MTRVLLLAFVIACGSKAPAPQSSISNTASPSGRDPIEPQSGGGGGADRDGDGIGDANDACPDDPEDYDGFGDEDGCPDPDNDQDGILDIDDLCPNNAENRNGVQDEDGCPE